MSSAVGTFVTALASIGFTGGSRGRSMPVSQAAGRGDRSAPTTVVTGSGRSGTARAAASRLSHVTTSVGVHEAKTHLSRLLERVAAGEEVEITNRGKVVARLVGPARRTPNFGFDRGNVWIADDFDELPEDLQRAFEGEE
jgi:prevent-host-death family protein